MTCLTMEKKKLKNPIILIAEDDEDDLFLLKRNFRSRYPQARLVHVQHGDELLEYLKTHENPSIIVLDLNMPKKDGRETLQEIHNESLKKDTLIVVFTTSASELDKQFVLDHDAVFYPKPYSIRAYALFMDLFEQHIR